MKRNDIRGFSIALFGHVLEVVTVYHVPSCIALSKGVKTIWRIER